MAYQALSRHEDGRPSDELPRYNEAAPGATSTGKRRAQPELEIPSYTQAVNYIHISDVGDIIGTVYHIDTDKPPAYGRFDSPEEQEQAPNVYLSAKTISAEIRLSGSKKAKIEIQGCTKAYYGRTMVRIVDASKQQPDGTHARPTPFSINVSATARGSVLVAVPASFSGAITGACSLCGHIRDEAVCLVADAKKSRWTVRQGEDVYPNMPAPADKPQYPPPSLNDGLLDTAEDLSPTASSDSEHSSVSFALLESPGIGDSSGKKQRERRHVVYDADYSLGLEKLDGLENETRKWVRSFLLFYAAGCFSYVTFVIMMVKIFDGPDEAMWAFVLFPLGVSIIIPAVFAGEHWSEYNYKPPSVSRIGAA